MPHDYPDNLFPIVKSPPYTGGHFPWNFDEIGCQCPADISTPEPSSWKVDGDALLEDLKQSCKNFPLPTRKPLVDSGFHAATDGKYLASGRSSSGPLNPLGLARRAGITLFPLVAEQEGKNNEGERRCKENKKRPNKKQRQKDREKKKGRKTIAQTFSWLDEAVAAAKRAVNQNASGSMNSR